MPCFHGFYRTTTISAEPTHADFYADATLDPEDIVSLSDEVADARSGRYSTNTPVLKADIAAPTAQNIPFPSRTDEELCAWLRFANVQFTARLADALLDAFRHDPRALFAASDAELEMVPGFQSRHRVRLRDPAYVPTPRQLLWIEHHGVSMVLKHEPNYPRLLLDIPDAPPLLFVRGTLSETDRFGVGMVGSRHATPYGRTTAERIARELAGHGLTVVSGGAVGIDAAAHRGAVQGGGRTLALLGCGLDVDYPRENNALFAQIVEQGAMISEYPLGAQPEAWRFPQRNRLISGLSLGTLVVEAPRQSGALITARYAVEHGRVVMAIPGNIDRPTSAGTNDLIKEGMTPVTETADILRVLNMVVVPARPAHQVSFALEADAEESEFRRQETGERRQEKKESARATSATPNTEHRTPNTDALLPEPKRKLLACLSLTPQHIDSVARQAEMTVSQAGVELTLLELDGLISRLPGNTYIRNL